MTRKKPTTQNYQRTIPEKQQPTDKQNTAVTM